MVLHKYAGVIGPPNSTLPDPTAKLWAQRRRTALPSLALFPPLRRLKNHRFQPQRAPIKTSFFQSLATHDRVPWRQVHHPFSSSSTFSLAASFTISFGMFHVFAVKESRHGCRQSSPCFINSLESSTRTSQGYLFASFLPIVSLPCDMLVPP
jgi:hypothetical protein